MIRWGFGRGAYEWVLVRRILLLLLVLLRVLRR